MTTSTFPVGGPVAVQVRVAFGTVEVEMVDDLSEAEVVLTPRRKGSDLLERVVVSFAGSTLVVRAPRQGGVFDLPVLGRRTRDELDISVRVPSGSHVQVVTYTAPITVRGRCGDADIAFGKGAATFEQVDGALRARFGDGTVEAIEVIGAVEVRSGAGSVRLGEVAGPVSVACGSGSVEIRLARGMIRSRTGSGSARIGAAHGDVDVVSGSGSVHIGVPEGVTARLDISTGSGDVQSQLPIEAAPRPAVAAPITLRARTSSGRVRLFRAA